MPVTIHPTWDVVGLRATASNDTSLTDFAVDRRHTCSFGDRPWADGPLWRLPLFVALAPTAGGVSLGIARGALDEINRQAVSAGRRCGAPCSTIPSAWATSAPRTPCCAEPGLDCSQRRRVLGREPKPADPIDRTLQARAFLAAQHCADVAVDVCATAHRLGGGAAAYRTSPLLRAVATSRPPDSTPCSAMASAPPRPHDRRHRRSTPTLRRLSDRTPDALTPLI